MNIYPGSKFFRFLEDREEPEIIRIFNVINKDKEEEKQKVTYLDKNNVKHHMNLSYLLDNYKLLKIDGTLMISIVTLLGAPDVVVALQKADAISNGPFAICRQRVSDVFSNNLIKYEHENWVGVSVNTDTCPANIDFRNFLLCEKLDYSISIAIYIDDKLEDILKLFSNTRFDNALKKCKKFLGAENPNYLGVCESIEELLRANNFMFDFRKCFGIQEIPFSIDPNSEKLSVENTLFLEGELKANIMETYVIKYDKGIDLKSIKRDYLLVSSAQDKFNNLYIVGYDTYDGPYVKRTSINPI